MSLITIAKMHLYFRIISIRVITKLPNSEQLFPSWTTLLYVGWVWSGAILLYLGGLGMTGVILQWSDFLPNIAISCVKELYNHPLYLTTSTTFGVKRV